ncbi:MAG: filamentous hemagglutinin N-terminal domain-containing protein [Cyanobacteria bacterium P01_F01_bin.116]
MVSYRHWLTLLSCTSALFPFAAMALPVPDTTVGTQLVPSAPDSIEIQGGTSVGQNLFHSFESFNIQTGESVFFLSPADINHIFSRVTGGSASEIDGVLGTLGSDANLFLINPNGIAFGPNASLDVQGSLIATTADTVELGPDGVFSALDSDSDQLLAVNPSAFFLSELVPSGEITFTGANLQVPNEQALVLLGGPVTLNETELTASGGRIEIAAVEENGRVAFASTDNALNLSNALVRGNIQVTDTSRIDTAHDTGGDIVLYAADFELSESSRISSGIFAGLGSADSQAGNIQLNATGTATLSNNGIIGNVVLGTGQGGDVIISALALDVLDGSQLAASTDGVGDAGNVIIQVQERVRFDGSTSDGQFVSAAFSDVALDGNGNSGNIEISANTLEVLNGAQLIVSTAGVGNAGNVIIQVQENVLFDGTSEDGRFPSAAFSDVASSGQGNGGNVEVFAKMLNVTNGAILNASTFGIGDAGNVIIQAQDSILFDGISTNGRLLSGAFSDVSRNAVGMGGSIEISADTLNVTNGARLNASTLNIGDAGDILIQARDNVLFDNSDAVSIVLENSIGEGGNIEIFTRSLELINGADLNNFTFGIGNAGNITIQAQDQVLFDNSTALSLVAPGAVGNGGNVTISANTLEVINNSDLSSITFGEGNAGSVIIQAQDSVRFDDSGATSAVDRRAQGDGGNVEISARTLNVNNNSLLSSGTLGIGNAGNVIIQARDSVLFENSSDVNSTVGNAAEGDGGNVEISANILEVNNESLLSTGTFGSGNAGNVIIQTQSSVRFENASVVGSSVGFDAEGRGGNIEISTNTLEVNNESQLTASTFGMGRAGNLLLQVGDQILLDNSGLFVASVSNSPAGNIDLISGEVQLENNSLLSAISTTVDGGNLLLNLDTLVLLRDGSQITATAGSAQTGGNGGNITITAPFIVAIPAENSDITANAFEGTGGRVTIFANGIFGIEPRLELTPLSDITASSEQGVSGIVAVNSLDTSFIQNDLTNLPDTLINSETLVASSCVVRSQGVSSSLTVTGNDLRESPTESSNTIYANGSVQPIAISDNLAKIPQSSLNIQEPSGIYRLGDGRLVMGQGCS